MMDHWTFKKGGKLGDQELQDIIALLSYEDDHLWIKDSATVGMFWGENDQLSTF